MSDRLILIDENDTPIGTEEKLKAHKLGKLHRAFSVFIFNKIGDLLLQRRSLNKYHSAGLWSNTCCSHPRPGEDTLAAAHRRLQEEMGFDCELKEVFSFFYKTEFENGLIENECDHIVIGNYDNEPVPNPEEVENYGWIKANTLKDDIAAHPEKYSVWLKISLDKVIKYLS